MGDKKNNAGITNSKFQRQKDDIDSMLCPGIHIVCSLL